MSARIKEMVDRSINSQEAERIYTASDRRFLKARPSTRMKIARILDSGDEMTPEDVTYLASNMSHRAFHVMAEKGMIKKFRHKYEKTKDNKQLCDNVHGEHGSRTGDDKRVTCPACLKLIG